MVTFSTLLSKVFCSVNRSGTVFSKGIQLLEDPDDINIIERIKRDVTAFFSAINMGLVVNEDKT